MNVSDETSLKAIMIVVKNINLKRQIVCQLIKQLPYTKLKLKQRSIYINNRISYHIHGGIRCMLCDKIFAGKTYLLKHFLKFVLF